jgi:hypothetical protein
VTDTMVQSWDLLGRATPVEPPPAPKPNATWEFDGGWAWVYYGAGNNGVVRPVVLADGFKAGKSSLNELWYGLNGNFPFAKRLLDARGDLIILGYKNRTGPIQDNARLAQECILRTIAERQGGQPLTVGGFSMGGLVTRYALARMEQQRVDHQTAVYLSYDSPHRGAWIPIALQALARLLAGQGIPQMWDQINSPAARQLLWAHIDSLANKPPQDPLRTQFLAELEQLGGWPQRPRKLGVANGGGDGVGNGVPAGEAALRCVDGPFGDTTLYTQAGGDQIVAEFIYGGAALPPISTSGFPELDGAPGGTLDGFELAGRNLAVAGQVDLPYGVTCFVPSVSAVAVRDIDADHNLSVDINGLGPEESELDEFICSRNDLPQPHTLMTDELGSWILDRVPWR